TALVFGLALLLAGVNSSFHNEVIRTVESFRADAWIVPKGVGGPISAPIPFPASQAKAVRSLPAVRAADPVIFGGALTGADLERVNVIGIVPNGVGSPFGATWPGFGPSGTAVVDASLGKAVGERFDLNGGLHTVVGVTHGLTYFAGEPVVVIPLADAQRIAFDGKPLATAIIARGAPGGAPPGFKILRNPDIESDLARPIAPARQTVAMVRSLLWIVAAGIIGAIVYLTALERTKDFAVLKATGASTSSLLGALILQAVVLTAVSAALAVGIEAAMQPAAAMSVEVSAFDFVTLVVVALVVGVIASLAAIRRAVTVDPALAFGG
ncbi:MAG TPA: ABC transporter permease, partial [Actinomycetota bacterium]|nr:ABC transporter permease [Actinomycetota bacterium]